MHSITKLIFCVVIIAAVAPAQSPAPDPPPAPPVATAVKPPEESDAKADGSLEPKTKDALSDPVEILTKANEATDAVKTVQYKVDIRRLDVAPPQQNEMRGTVLMTGWTGERPEKFRFEIESRPAGESNAREVVVGSDGKQFYSLNKKSKTFTLGDDPAALGFYQIALRYFPMYEFVIPDPFRDEITASKLRFRGVERVDDEDCYAIHIEYTNQNQEAIWYFAQRDFLPRRVQRLLFDPDGAPLSRQTTVSHIVIDPKLDENVFAFEIPEGFTKAKSMVP